VKILLVVHQFLPRHAAGTEIYAYHLAKELQARGHGVHLYFTEIHDDRPQYELRKGEYEGLPFHEAVHNHFFPSFTHHYLDPDQEKNFVTVLDEVKPDLVHFQHLHLHSLGYIDIAKHRGLPIAYTLHEYILMCLRGGQLLPPDGPVCQGPEPEKCAACATLYPLPEEPERRPPSRREMQVKSWMPRPVRKFLGRFRAKDGKEAAPLVADEPQVSGDPYVPAVQTRLEAIKQRLAKVDLFISPSAFLRDRFIDNGFLDPDKILFSDNGFFVEPFEALQGREDPPVDAENLRVGFVGTIVPFKGVHVLVEAFQGIEEPGVICRIWGDLGTFPDYKAQLMAMEKPDNLVFEGRFDNSKIAEVLAQVDVLVVPSIWFENSPLTIHEAFLAGIPVLASDQGGMAELVEDGVNGLHFRMGDAADLRAKILRLAREEGLLASLRAFPHIKTIAEDTDLMERRYEKLLAGETPRT
jgi:glycosyltransferase involved in cell wall biosynthesis